MCSELPSAGSANAYLKGKSGWKFRGITRKHTHREILLNVKGYCEGCVKRERGKGGCPLLNKACALFNNGLVPNAQIHTINTGHIFS